jgi:hypothetical protein
MLCMYIRHLYMYIYMSLYMDCEHGTYITICTAI